MRGMCRAAFAAVVIAAILPAGAVADGDGGDVCATLRSVTQTVLNNVMWPTSRNIVLSRQPPAQFAPDAVGRVVPVGVFKGSFGALEYFYALAGPLGEAKPSDTRVVSVKFRLLMCDADLRRTAYDVLIQFADGTGGQDYVLNVHGFFVFNNNSQIQSYDWTIRRLAFAMQARVASNAQQYGIPVASAELFARVSLVNGICAVAARFCTGNLTVYANTGECVRQLGRKPYGTLDYGDQDNINCRSIHSLLVPVRPEVHCVHIGPDGGGLCVTHPYEQFIAESYV